MEFYTNLSYSRGKYTKNAVSKIAIVYPILKLKEGCDSELYYKQKCILHIPFRENFDTLLRLVENDAEQTWESLANQYKLNEPSINAHDLYCEVLIEGDKEFAEVVDIEEENKYIGIFEKLSAAHLSPDENVLGKRKIDVLYDWSAEKVNHPSYEQIVELLKEYKNKDVISKQDDVDCNVQILLSDDQVEVRNVVQKHIKYWHTGEMSKARPKDALMIVQGKAGSGKSTIIKKTQQDMHKHFGIKSLAITAPTGCAALNVDGETLHSCFKIPIYNSEFQPLSAGGLHNIQQTHKHLKLVIIDEMSLIGCRLLYKVEHRCKEIFPGVSESFGGMHVYLFGDFNQLPPVGDTPFFSNNINNMMSSKGKLIFSKFKKFIELKSTHRQSDPQFIGILDRLAAGCVTQEDYKILCTRRQAVLSKVDKDRFEHSIKLFAKNETVKKNNILYLMKMQTPVANIIAVDSCRYLQDEENAGLVRKLYIATGCRVMLRTNLWVKGGLVNGSLGTVNGILYDDNTCPPQLPRYILVKFDNYKGKCLGDGSFPIIPIIRTWTGRNNQNCSRKQFPLTLAYATTIHKAQGLTLPNAVIDIEEKDFAAGLSYVAYSRVRNLEDILIPTPYDYNRLHKIGLTKMSKIKNEFFYHLRSLQDSDEEV